MRNDKEEENDDKEEGNDNNEGETMTWGGGLMTIEQSRLALLFSFSCILITLDVLPLGKQ